MKARCRSAGNPVFKLRYVFCAPVIAAGIAFAGFVGEQAWIPAQRTENPALESIADVYRPLYPAADGSMLSGRVFVAAAESLFYSQGAFLRLHGDEPSEWDSRESGVFSNRAPGTSAAGVSRAGPALPPTRVAAISGLSAAAALVFENSFADLFSSLFGSPTGGPDRFPADSLEEDGNPFSEAKLKDRAEAAEKAAAAGPEPAAKDASTDDSRQAQSPQPERQDWTSGGNAALQPDRFVVLGDFDGTGALRFAEATRTGDAVFVFSDRTWTFSLYLNPVAVEGEKSFTIEDVNGDGFDDLLVTSKVSMFGGVLLGNGAGDFRVARNFFTGYASTVTAVGPWRDEGREIITINTRTGSMAVFRPQGVRYIQYRAGNLEFLPDYASHLVNLISGNDYLLAAQAGARPRLYLWQPDSYLEASSEVLPGEAGLHLRGDPQSKSVIGSIQVFQVGGQASVVLGNKSGQIFNVANLRVTPQIFLLMGNLANQGTLDVAVGHLISSKPAK